MKRLLALGFLASSFLAPALAHAQGESATTVDEVIVVAPAPFGGGVSLDRLGQTVTGVGADQIADTGSLSISDAMQQNIPGINVSDTQGNPFTGDVNYRGFTASALQGLPQGLAVYLNGMRLNEAFGDTMNWDLIPQAAIQRIDLVTNNPAFGLNAIGGALALRTHTGASFDGAAVEVQGGSFGTWQGSAQSGWQGDRSNAFLAIDGGKIDGWRFHSPTSVARGFADFGFNLDNGEIHLLAGASNSNLGVVGPTPVDLLEDDRRAVFTFPQLTHNQAQFVAVHGRWDLSDSWSLQGGVHFRRYKQEHADGNDGDFERCASTGPFANTLCLEDDSFPSTVTTAELQLLDEDNNPIPCPVSTVDTNGCRNRISAQDGPRVPYGALDRTATITNTTGATILLTNDADLSGRKNTLNFGAAFDSSDIHFRSSSTLALINPELEVVDEYYTLPDITGTVPGLGSVIHASPNVAYGPASIAVKSRNTGVFASDTLDVSENLSVTLAARYNTADVDMKDLTGNAPQLTANHHFSRFNPAVNFALRSGSRVFYGGYSETNRAPTPLELGCSDPLRPCLLENSLVADPPLKQVVSRTFEVGGRGRNDMGAVTVSWAASAFSTNNTDDIVSVASTIAGRGYYTNVPKTRRTGFEGQVNLGTAAWSAFVGYSHVDATYQFTGTLASPNNEEADADGNIEVNPGDHIGGIPQDRFKAGFDITRGRFTIGADAQYIGAQHFVGDEGNDNPRLPSYWVAGARADFELNDKVSLFVRVENLFDEDYASYGTYFDEDGVQKVRPQPFGADPDAETVTPGAPRAVYVGLRAKFR